MQKITPNLWFDDNAEEAARFYQSVFRDVKIGTILRYDATMAQAAGRPEASVMTVEFEIFGQRFIGINGGPAFAFSEAVSFMVTCDTQREIDDLWNALTSDGGQESQCGWLKDKFGVSWQIVPRSMDGMMVGADPAKRSRMLQAMLGMRKLDMAALQRAYDGQ